MYIAIDIETTGLDPENDQVLEFAAVLQSRGNVLDCPYFQKKIWWTRLNGSPFALNLNSRLLEGMIAVTPPFGPESDWCLPNDLGKLFRKWLSDQEPWSGTLFPVGKNYASFDRQFLYRMKGWPKEMFGHRTLDVGSLYADTLGIRSQKELVETYGPFNIPGDAHEALYDARVSLELALLKLLSNEKR